MIDQIKKISKKGFFHIFGSNIINKIIQFSSSIFLVRILTKEEFGLFSYSQNLLMFFLLLNGLGVVSGMLQYGSETDNNQYRNSYFKYGIKVGLLFNLVVGIIIVFYSDFFPLKIQRAEPILTSMFLLPIVIFLFESIQIYFRASLENKKFSFLNTLNTFLLFICSVVGAYFFGVLGLVSFMYIGYFITIIIGVILLKSVVMDVLKAPKLLKKVKKEFMKFSIISSFNNAVSQLLYIIDIFLIGLILMDEKIIASYKIATLIPFALNFIPISIMMFIYPYFAKNNKDKKWIKSSYLKLTKYLLVINLLISLILIIFAPLIIKIIFGSQYQDAVVPFRILALGYFFAATFRIPIGNILVMLRKVKFGLYLSIITGILNIFLDIILIKNYGSIGAAFSTVFVFVFTSIMALIYFTLILRER